MSRHWSYSTKRSPCQGILLRQVLDDGCFDHFHVSATEAHVHELHFAIRCDQVGRWHADNAEQFGSIALRIYRDKKVQGSVFEEVQAILNGVVNRDGNYFQALILIFVVHLVIEG